MGPVSRREILSALQHLREQGTERVLAELLAQEPHLAGFVTENLGKLREELLAALPESAAADQIAAGMESFVLVCVLMHQNRR